MSRKHRMWYPGAVYHITARGNKRFAIFVSDLDYLKYFTILEEVREMYPFIIHSYCFMENHLHLQLETIDHPISLIMKALHGRYAVYFNRKYRTDGHVFQGRFGAKLIENSDYFLEVSRYIHRNPVEAQMVKKPEDYLWSSYSAYAYLEKNPIITTTKTLSYFPEPSHQLYRKFVERAEIEEEQVKVQIPKTSNFTYI